MICIFIFLGLELSLIFFLSKGIAFVTSIGIPIAVICAIIFMDQFGLTINLLTMFAFIIVLGILVDDGIIVAENIWHHYEHGETPLNATINGTYEVVIPVTATILTTIAAFSPLMMMSGVMGDFIINMPMVVIAALTASWLEAM